MRASARHVVPRVDVVWRELQCTCVNKRTQSECSEGEEGVESPRKGHRACECVEFRRG